jgi:integrase
MEELTERIKKNRPNLSDNSVKTYNSILRNLYFKVYNKPDEKFNIDKFDNYKLVSDYINNNIDNKKRKTYYSALLVLSNDDKIKDKYKSLMIEDINNYNEFINTNKKDEKQKKNWITQDEINTLRNDYKKNVNILLRLKKETLNISDIQYIQQYIILCLYTMIEPRRLLDYTNMKINNKNITNNDNYIDKNNFVFQKYKTSKFYKTQIIPIPKELNIILKKWIKLIKDKSEYLLFDNNYNKLNVVQLNQRLNRIFGNKKISVNILRHSYITNEMKQPINNVKELLDSSKNMGHSLETHLQYIKN